MVFTCNNNILHPTTSHISLVGSPLSIYYIAVDSPLINLCRIQAIVRYIGFDLHAFKVEAILRLNIFFRSDSRANLLANPGI